jgi:hypothetical protein
MWYPYLGPSPKTIGVKLVPCVHLIEIRWSSLSLGRDMTLPTAVGRSMAPLKQGPPQDSTVAARGLLPCQRVGRPTRPIDQTTPGATEPLSPQT